MTDSSPVGPKLKSARQERRLTLDEVAARCGITKGYLSKLERDQASASVATLLRICEALEIPVGSLFDPSPTAELVRVSQYAPVRFWGEQVKEYLLTPKAEARVQLLLSVLGPGGGRSSPYVVPAEVEVGVVVEGTVKISLWPLGEDADSDGAGAPREEILGPGDVLTFSPRDSHSFVAVGGPARVLWVVVPAMPLDS